MENIQSLESARSYRQEYKVKGWVDARDCGQKWRLGRIKKILDGKVLISFDGWSEKYNQVRSGSGESYRRIASTATTSPR